MSPTLNGSSALQHFEHGKAVEIRNGISTWDCHKYYSFYCVGYQVHYYHQNGNIPVGLWPHGILHASGSNKP